MFLLNCGSSRGWSIPTSVANINGVVYLPSGAPSEKVIREAQREYGILLFDPQLYLTSLDGTASSKTCARLSTYSWFDVQGLPDYDSGEQSIQKWEQSLRPEVAARWPGQPPAEDRMEAAVVSCLSFQVGLGCTHVILPTPLVAEREEEAAALGRWIDAGLAAAAELEVDAPLLACVAVAEEALSTPAVFEPAGFLDTIVDQVTARSGLDGVYVVVAQARAGHPFDVSQAVSRAYLQLSGAFSRAGYATVLTNFADLLGLCAMGVGAHGFAGGTNHGTRRLSLAGFGDKGFGLPLPWFYSHRAAAEFRPQSDLDAIVEAGVLARVRDVTPSSQPLMHALSNGGSAAQVASWLESKNNTSAALHHYVARLAIEEGKLSGAAAEDRTEAVRDWLLSAEGTRSYLRSKIATSIEPRYAPIERWLEYLDAVTGQ